MAWAAIQNSDAFSLRRIALTGSGLVVIIGLFVFAGAFAPLLLSADGFLDPGDRSKLRMLELPVYAASLAVLAARPGRLAWALLCNWPLVMLITLPFLSSLWSVSGSISLRRAIALALSMSLALVLATRFTPRAQLRIFGAVLGGCTAMSLVFGGLVPSLAWMPDQAALRGIFVHKNVLGWVSSFTVVFAVAGLADTAPGMRKVAWGLLLIGLTGTVFSASATSLLASGFAILLAQTARMIAQRQGLARVALEMTLVLSAGLLLTALSVALIPTLEALGKDATLTGRVPLWALVDQSIGNHLTLGYGYGAFWTDANPDAWVIWEAVGWKAPHAHSGYRDVMLSFGLVGALLFALTVIRAIGQAFVLYTARPTDGTLWCILILGTSLLLNLSESTFLMQNDLMWVMMASAIATVAVRRAEMQHATAVPFRPEIRAV